MRQRLPRIVLLILTLPILALVVGCQSGAEGYSKQEVASNAPISANAFSGVPASSGVASGAEAPSTIPMEEQAKDSSRAPASKSPTSPDEQISATPILDREPDRFLIKNATIHLEVVDPPKAADSVLQKAKLLKGYVSETHESVDGLGAKTITMKVRVPFNHFENFMKDVEGNGKALDKQITSEDVTEEFVDTRSRAKNLKSTENRLLEHLSKTGKLSDTLLIEKELTRVRQEIEQLEGRLRFLGHRISYSTIDLTLSERARVQPITPPQHYSPGKTATDAMRSLVELGQSGLNTLIWLAVWAVVWLPIMLIAWFGGKKVLSMVKPWFVANFSTPKPPQPPHFGTPVAPQPGNNPPQDNP